MKRSLFHTCLRFGVLVGLLPGLVHSLEAKPDFTASEITTESKTVLEGEVAPFKLWLRNREGWIVISPEKGGSQRDPLEIPQGVGMFSP